LENGYHAGFGLAKLCATIKNTMIKTLQTIVGATEAIFFAAVTMISVAMKMV
jgi:hypothetical protein